MLASNLVIEREPARVNTKEPLMASVQALTDNQEQVPDGEQPKNRTLTVPLIDLRPNKMSKDSEIKDVREETTEA